MLGFIKKLFSSTPTPSNSGLSQAEIKSHVELAVEHFDSRLKLIPGYQRKLAPAVEIALVHAKELIEKIPEPLEISKSLYAKDPHVHAYFGSLDQLQHLFSHSPDFNTFAKLPSNFGVDHGYALMIMSRQQKSRLGHALKGEMVQGEVMQEVIYFTSHKLVKPSSTEEGVRFDLRERAFLHLVAEAVAKVADHAKEKADLEREKVHLSMQLKTQHAEHGALDFTDFETTEGSTGQRLAKVEQQIAELSRGLETINDYMELLIKVLSQPDLYCGLKPITEYVDRMNVISTPEEGTELHYAKIRIGELNQAAIIVSYPFAEMESAF